MIKILENDRSIILKLFNDQAKLNRVRRGKCNEEQIK